MPNSKYNFSENIVIKGAKVHNLKNLDIEIPRDKLVVITGLSGSGKSSLAFDTLYAEGQRRYVESISSYARQFLGKMTKPEVDYIKGIPPSIAIEQKVNTRNPRSTVGTSTEIYDYLKLLFARIGRTFSPVSNQLVKKISVTDVTNYIVSLPENSVVLLLVPLEKERIRYAKADGVSPQVAYLQLFKLLQSQGFTRLEINGKIEKIADEIKIADKIKPSTEINVIIDRIKVARDEDTVSRVADSVQTAYYEGKDECLVKVFNESNTELLEQRLFSNKFELDGIVFEEPSALMFSFNNPVGACPTCEGFGSVIGIDEDLVIPNKTLSIYEDAVACWKGEKMSEWKHHLIMAAPKFDFPVHKPYYQLSAEQKKLLWTGNKFFAGLDKFFETIEAESYKIQYRVMLSHYRGKTVCHDCHGTRLKKEAAYVKIAEKSIHELVLMPIRDLKEFFDNIQLTENEAQIAKRLLIEIKSRLLFVCEVGLGYLTLNRLSSTLSGGESQRINLATSLGSSLVGSLYILDEPSIGLHSRDTDRLISVLRRLQRIGNSVLVVEHDESMMRAADQIIDIGPLAGIHGGEVVFQGTHAELEKSTTSMTARYLTGKEQIEIPKTRRKWNNFIEIVGALENNLKSINVKFPLNVLTVVSGVSGSGKSSLVRNILYSALNKQFNGYGERTGQHAFLRGDTHLLHGVEFVDQNPIGKSSRSNPVTYIKAYDEIRQIFADQQLSKQSGFQPSHFSFNVEGGRCDECQGEGIIRVEMQFMADVTLICESCKGKRFKQDVLDVHYQGKSIFDILDMTVEEAIEFFGKKSTSLERKLLIKLQTLNEVGLGYVRLGQSSSTLSGGESQRIKLASFLTKENESRSLLFIFDEPTTGLHFHDIKKLLKAFQALIERGNSIVIIEHNLDVIKCADWVIDLGPEGGNTGGNLVCEGKPEDIVKCEESYTGHYLKEKLHSVSI